MNSCGSAIIPACTPLHLKTFEDVNRVVRMDGGQHQMPGHGGFYCRNGGIVVTDFAVQGSRQGQDAVLI